jgi:gp16 family phage-associated protein
LQIHKIGFNLFLSINRYKGVNTMTPQEAKAVLQAQGVIVAKWAEEHGFTLNGVYRVLNGRTACLRGETHRIAVALGIKEEVAGNGK